MKRNIVKIDQEKCIGCGLCANACHEGAIKIVDGKATLIRDDYCDGLGNCLPHCPVDAISIEERSAIAYNKSLAPKRLNKSGCSSDKGQSLDNNSELNSWPIQIRLIAENHEKLNNADLLIAADCTAFAYKNFHGDFLKDKVCLIACPKLDDFDYIEKLKNIININNLKSITLVKMEVPCCMGLENFLLKAIEESDKNIMPEIITVSLDGKII